MRAVRCLMLMAAAVAAGCGGPTSAPAPPAVTPSYSYEVRGGGSVQRGQAESFAVTAGPNTTAVNGGRLTVNGRSYGSLRSGDSVVVDEAGKVTVNGTERPPE